MPGPRATLTELSEALTAAGVGVYLYDGARRQSRWITGHDGDASAPVVPLMRGLQSGEETAITDAGHRHHHLIRLDDNADGAPRFVGVIRGAERGSMDAGLDRLMGVGDGRSGLQAHLTHLAETLDPAAQVAICALGVDGMREFCRIYGYDCGESLLHAVGRRLLEALPDGAVLARIGGAKFAAVLRAADGASLEAEAALLAAAVQNESFDVGIGPVSVSLSVGGALASPQALTTPAPFDAALAALDEVRGEGEGGFRIDSGGETNPLSPAAMRAGAQAVMRALQDDRIALAFQPIVVAHDPTRIAFRECLARVQGEDGRWISAGLFLPQIERLDLIRTLDRRVLRLALDALIAHPTERLSVNVSARTMRDRPWLETLTRVATAEPNVVERLIVELTESSAVVDLPSTKGFLDAIRSLGVAIALDDFGAGYSSFRHVRDFRPDWVKIDGSFVTGLANDADNKLFVDTLVGIARNFDMATVAEFVENEADAEALRALGVDCLQGYHYGRPEIAPRWQEGGGAIAG